MVSQVRTRAITRQKALGRVRHIGQYRFVMAAIEKFQDVETVVVLTRETMLWGETVMDGDNNGGEFTCEAAANGVVGFGGGREEGETTAVVEDENGEGS